MLLVEPTGRMALRLTEVAETLPWLWQNLRPKYLQNEDY